MICLQYMFNLNIINDLLGIAIKQKTKYRMHAAAIFYILEKS